MKKYFFLQIFYVICTITLLSLFWEFVLEGHLYLDGHEEFDEKIGGISTTIAFILIALAYPKYKGLSISATGRNWKRS